MTQIALYVVLVAGTGLALGVLLELGLRISDWRMDRKYPESVRRLINSDELARLRKKQEEYRRRHPSPYEY